MSKVRLKYLFHQFVNKTASPEEVREFLDLVEKGDFNGEIQTLLDDLWHDESNLKKIDDDHAERIFNQLMEASAEHEESNVFKLPVFWLKAAAILVIGISTFFYINKPQRTESRVAKVKIIKPSKPDKPSRRFINLPDGSSVILNENSKIELGANFKEGGPREVYLEGEAYFDITHDTDHPFIVHTGKIQTTVLGTAFNIKANSGNKKVIVSVTRGKVKVGDKEHIYNVLIPNEQLVFDQKQNTVVKKPVKSEEVVKWTSEDIYFDDVNMKDVANQLQERFNISIRFANDQMKGCKFSATFLKDQNLEQILNVIGAFNQINYKFLDAKTVQLDGAGCK